MPNATRVPAIKPISGMVKVLSFIKNRRATLHRGLKVSESILELEPGQTHRAMPLNVSLFNPVRSFKETLTFFPSDENLRLKS
jgi:hypothetical protein